MFLVSAAEMRQIDHYTIDTLNIPELVLMENAGRAVAEEVIRYSRDRFPHLSSHRWIVLAGKGNNGADGLVVARHLAEAGFHPTVLYVTNPALLEGSALQQKKMAESWGIPIQAYDEMNPVTWHEYDGIVDALLGTGSTGPPREPMATIIREANDSALPIVSIDIPSGIDADSGQLYEPCIQAELTVALAILKKGMVQQPARDRCGDIQTRPIGIPFHVAEKFQIRCHFVNERFVQHYTTHPANKRPADAHKGTFGHLAIVAGSKQYSGAGILVAKAAHRMGCGLVTWMMPSDLQPSFVGASPETILLPVDNHGANGWQQSDPEQIALDCENKQAIVIGPGLHRFDKDKQWLNTIIANSAAPLVLDADALNIIADDPSILDTVQARTTLTACIEPDVTSTEAITTIITPHPGEMARLCGLTIAQVQQNRVGVATEFAKKHRVIVVLKGAGTVTVTPDGSTYINSTGNAGMATGGTGDVLAGMIGSLLAQGYTAELAAVLGVYYHGEAGDIAASNRRSATSLIASDLIDVL